MVMSWVWYYIASDFETPVLGSAEYPFIAITFRSTLAWSSHIYKVLSLDQIDLFKTYLYLIGILDAI